MDDKQTRLEGLKTRLQSVSYDDYEIGLPYNEAKHLSTDYEEYVEFTDVVEETARTCGVPEGTLSTLRAAYEAVFYPHEYDYIIKDGLKVSTIPPYNASEDEALTEIQVGDHNIHLNLGPYYFEGDQLYYKEEKKEPLAVSPHPIVPIGVIINPDMTEKVVIWFKQFGMEKTIEEPKIIIYDKGKIKRLIAYGIEPSADLVNYFRTIEALNRNQNPDFQTIVEGRQMGWTDDTYSMFYPYDTANYRCSVSPKNIEVYNAVRSVAGTFEGWLENVNRFRDREHIAARIVLAASFASVLVQPLDSLPVILHLWGTKSNTGKTMALTTAASIWANPKKRGGYLAAMNTTMNAMIKRAQFFNSFPLCFDELQTVKNKKDLQDMIYNLSEGFPRDADTLPGGGVPDLSSWHNCTLTNGEQSILTWTTLAGASNRVIEIACGDRYVYSEDVDIMLDYLQKLGENYNHAGRRFIAHLEEPGSIDQAKQLYSEFIHLLNHQATNKQTLAAAIILTADTLSCDWIFQDDLKLTIEELLPYLKDDDDIDTGTRMQEYINQWIAMNKPRMLKNEKPGKITTVKGRHVCAIPSETFKNLLTSKGYDSRAYFSWAVEHDQAIRDDDGRHFERHVTINGQSVRCACIILSPDAE